ncbi:MAG: heme exporter protein CcmD [Pseudomonadota bacterium]|nr:heme exporter protein CcmD [Pseudomonadota bacterium]
MGGYALYVWGSVGVTAVVMIAIAAAAILRHRRELCRISRRLRRERKMYESQA